MLSLFNNIKVNIKKIRKELYPVVINQYVNNDDMQVEIAFNENEIVGWRSIEDEEIILYVKEEYLIPSICIRPRPNKDGVDLQCTFKYHTPIWRDCMKVLFPNNKNKNFCYFSLSQCDGSATEFVSKINEEKKNFVEHSVNQLELVITENKERKQTMILSVLDNLLDDVMELCNEKKCDDETNEFDDPPMPSLSPRKPDHPFGPMPSFDNIKW